MTRFGIDTGVLLAIAAGEVDVHADHQLVAPGSLRSQAQSALYAAARRGELDRKVALERLERITEIRVRLLNDRVSRSVAGSSPRSSASTTRGSQSSLRSRSSRPTPW